MTTYAIGDIQGCLSELKQLLHKLNFSEDKDILWLTGDLVNRGPDSLGTLRYLHSIKDNVVTVLGNHDLHLLALAYTSADTGKKDTLDDILQAPDREVLLDWLISQPLIHYDSNRQLTLVHAALHPCWTIEKSLELASEVESILQSKQRLDFFNHMYGNQPDQWDDTLEGWDRIRCITNIMTRMRYCDVDGRYAMQYKREPGTQPENFIPWYEIKNRASRNNRIIFGHWSTLCLIETTGLTNVYPIDTGCLWGGKLTALNIDEEPFKHIAHDCSAAMQPE